MTGTDDPTGGDRRDGGTPSGGNDGSDGGGSADGDEPSSSENPADEAGSPTDRRPAGGSSGRRSRDSADGRPSGRELRAVLVRWFYPHVLLAAGTFLLGAAAGAGAMAATSPEAVAAAAEATGSPDPFPDRLTTWTVFANNVVALAVVAAGAVSFGLAAVVALLFNGLLVGAVVYAGAGAGGLATTLALILPHGVLELSAFFLVGGVTYRISWRLVAYLRGAEGPPITRREALEAVALAAAAVVAVAVAAWIEANLTLAIARALLGPGAVPGAG